MRTHNWVIEFRANSRSNMFHVTRTIVSINSPFQEILLAEVEGHGKSLFLDGIPQSSQVDEFIYHEALAHPALVAHRHPVSVFVAGGAEGAIVREILKHKTVKRVVLVDIDAVLVDLAKQHLAEWHQGLYDDPRVQLVCQDARKYLAETQETFDTIMLDLTDPLDEGLAPLLFTAEFFTLARSRLNAGGTFSMQAETTDLNGYGAHVSVIRTLQSVFKYVHPYSVFIPFYGLSWGFAVASDQDISPRFIAQQITSTLQERNCTALRLYDAEAHQHMFALPKYLRAALASQQIGRVIHDDQVLTVQRPTL
jgi:spermidine synthase